MGINKGKIFSNTTFDADILKLIIKRNWYWCTIILFLFISGAYLFLRYTKPIYEAKILIQINSENQSENIFELKNIRQHMMDNSFSKEVELLRSKMFFQRVISSLPLQITHHTKGEFLTETRYKSNNYEVDLLYLKDSSMYQVPIYLCGNEKEITLSFLKDDKEYKYVGQPNKILETPFFDINVTPLNSDDFSIECLQNRMYFQFNKLSNLANLYYQDLTVQPVDFNARTVELKYRSYSPRLAHDITTSAATEFFQYYEELRKEGAENILEFIEVQLDSLKVELSNAKDSVISYRRKEDINDGNYFSETLLNEITKLQAEENLINDELRILDRVKNRLNNPENSIEVYRLLPIILGSSYEASLSEQIRGFYELVESKENLSHKVTPDNESIIRINEKIEIRKEIINDIVGALYERSNEKLAIIQEKIIEKEDFYNKIPNKRMELDRLKNVQLLNEKYYNLLTEKKVMYSISNAGYSSDNKILDAGTVPSTPIFPRKGVVYGLSIFLALFSSVGFLGLRYISFNNIVQYSDLKRIIPEYVKFAGIIPYSNIIDESALLVTKHSKSSLSEAFRSLRINLSFINNDIRTISITSTIPQEGKTFVILNLAGIISMLGKKVIVVDLDMRKPKIHIAFNARNNIGMSNLLANHCSLDDVIQKSELENLDFISAGTLPPNPSELVLSKKFDEVFDELKEKYDVVLFDNPPIGLVSDGIPIMNRVDVPLFVFRANYSKRYFMDDLRELVKMESLKNIYVILNGVKLENSTFGRRYGSGYGYYAEDE